MNSEQKYPEYDGPERRAYHPEPWHIKREVTWGHLMSTITLLVLLAGSWFNMSNAIQETKGLVYTNTKTIEEVKDRHFSDIEHVKELNTIQNRQFTEVVKEVKEQYQRLDEKLDKLIDKQLGN